MRWLDAMQDIEDLEDAGFDAALVADFERHADRVVSRPIRFSTPTFKEYESSELQGCGKNSFPAFSITAGECGLNCDHCQKKILEPMIPATSPDMLDEKVRHLVATQGLNGFLLSGGSNRKNEIPYGRYMPVVEGLKRDFPGLKIAVHTALLDERRAKEMESSGVDTVMMDVIGAQETIEQVYKLKRPVEDFEQTLALVDTVGFAEGFFNARTPHSDQLHVVEQFSFDAEANQLDRSYTATDSLYWTEEQTGSNSMDSSPIAYNPEVCEDLTIDEDVELGPRSGQ